MDQFAKDTHPISLEKEMRRSYLDYAMSVIGGRALPDVRDGLKPVHRRVLFAMHELSNDWNKAYKKSARIVGDVIGKYHPHGDTAVYDTIVRMAHLKNPETTLDELIKIIPAPDFPTAGIIYGVGELQEGYRSGRGRVIMRARCHIEDLDKAGRQAIIIDELPYQVNKAQLLIKIGEMVREKRLEGISDLRDESDKSGMRAVIELKRGEVAEIVLNNLYKLTQMQETFGMNMVALLDGQPKLLNLRQFLDAFLRHRREVVTRRTVFDLRKARDRGHILEGLAVALSNVDEVIAIIKRAATPAVAKGE